MKREGREVGKKGPSNQDTHTPSIRRNLSMNITDIGTKQVVGSQGQGKVVLQCLKTPINPQKGNNNIFPAESEYLIDPVDPHSWVIMDNTLTVPSQTTQFGPKPQEEEGGNVIQICVRKTSAIGCFPPQERKHQWICNQCVSPYTF